MSRQTTPTTPQSPSSGDYNPESWKAYKTIWDVDQIEGIKQKLMIYVTHLHENRSVSRGETPWAVDTAVPPPQGEQPLQPPDSHLDRPGVVNTELSKTRYIWPVQSNEKLPGIVFETAEPIKSPITPRKPHGAPKPGQDGSFPAPEWMRIDDDLTNVTLTRRWWGGFSRNNGENLTWGVWEQGMWARVLPNLYNMSGFLHRGDPLLEGHIEAACDLTVRDVIKEQYARVLIVQVPFYDDLKVKHSGVPANKLASCNFIVFSRHNGGGKYTSLIVNQRNGLCLYSDSAWDVTNNSNPGKSETSFRTMVKLVRNWYRIHEAPAETQELIDHASFVVPQLQIESEEDLWKCGLYAVDFIRCVIRQGIFSIETSYSETAAEAQEANPNLHKNLFNYWVRLITEEFGPYTSLKGLRPKPKTRFKNWLKASKGKGQEEQQEDEANTGPGKAMPDQTLVTQESIRVEAEDPAPPRETNRTEDVVYDDDPDPATFVIDAKRKDCPGEVSNEVKDMWVEMENKRRELCRAKIKRRVRRLKLPKANRPSDLTLKQFLIA